MRKQCSELFTLFRCYSYLPHSDEHLQKFMIDSLDCCQSLNIIYLGNHILNPEGHYWINLLKNSKIPSFSCLLKKKKTKQKSKNKVLVLARLAFKWAGPFLNSYLQHPTSFHFVTSMKLTFLRERTTSLLTQLWRKDIQLSNKIVMLQAQRLIKHLQPSASKVQNKRFKCCRLMEWRNAWYKYHPKVWAAGGSGEKVPLWLAGGYFVVNQRCMVPFWHFSLITYNWNMK